MYMLFRVLGYLKYFFFFFFLNRSHVHCAEKNMGNDIYIYIFFLYRYFRNISLEYFSIKKFSFSTIFFLFSSQCFLVFQFFSFTLLLSLSSPYPFSLSLLLLTCTHTYSRPLSVFFVALFFVLIYIVTRLC